MFFEEKFQETEIFTGKFMASIEHVTGSCYCIIKTRAPNVPTQHKGEISLQVTIVSLDTSTYIWCKGSGTSKILFLEVLQHARRYSIKFIRFMRAQGENLILRDSV